MQGREAQLPAALVMIRAPRRARQVDDALRAAPRHARQVGDGFAPRAAPRQDASAMISRRAAAAPCQMP